MSEGARLAGDVTGSAMVDAMVEQVSAYCGPFNILVNGAGGWQRIQPIAEIADDEWERLITLNLTCAFYCSRAAARIMIENNRGRIISITSNAEIAPSPGVPSSLPYSAGKAGLIGTTKLLTRDLEPHGITANCIAPDTTATPRVRKARDQESLDRLPQPILWVISWSHLMLRRQVCLWHQGKPDTSSGLH